LRLSATWSRREPQLDIGLPVPHQRSDLDKTRAAALKTPAPQRGHTDIQDYGYIILLQ
jgi:hypothetical protein